MKKVLAALLLAGLWACNNGTNADNASNSDVPSDSSLRPRPVTEAITNDTRIVNDSVIVPDTNNVGPNPSDGVDTLGPKAKQNNQNKNKR
jgi:hypothetical protein